MYVQGKKVKKAYPGQCVEITTTSELLCKPGDDMRVCKNNKEASDAIEYRYKVKNAQIQKERAKKVADLKYENEKRELRDRIEAIDKGLDEDSYLKEKEDEREGKEAKTVPLVIKVDTFGSLEAITDMLDHFPDDEIKYKIISQGVGDISPTDIKYVTPDTSDPDNVELRGVVVGFNVDVQPSANKTKEISSCDVKTFKIIYELFDWLNEMMSSKLPPTEEVRSVAELTIKESFPTKRNKVSFNIAGCYVEQGTISIGSDVRVLRERKDFDEDEDDEEDQYEVVWEGKIRQLREFKDSVRKVHAGKECGIMFTSLFSDFRKGDRIVAIKRDYHPRTYFSGSP
eukprot:TRINITY_DN7531_c0_g1_i1.p2 TRINITY_DN7531_c0_g1~~TRINITY_DN7531_c0_g1_i1.p2  ORF type:complete len:342 (-),score=87.81 TRINITY_DN7531_c0_g1_i1:996-2021(-)